MKLIKLPLFHCFKLQQIEICVKALRKSKPGMKKELFNSDTIPGLFSTTTELYPSIWINWFCQALQLIKNIYIVSIRCITCKYAVALCMFWFMNLCSRVPTFFTHDLFSVMGILMRLLSISTDVNRCLLHTTDGQKVWSDSMIQEGGFWVADNHWVEHLFCKDTKKLIHT